MLAEPNCFTRKCKYFTGVDQPDGTEMTERVVCEAYLKGIPGDIAYGDDLHLKVRSDQKNQIIYEEEK